MGSGIKQVYGAELSKVYTATEVANDKPYLACWAGQLRQDEKGNVFRFVKNGEASTALAVGNSACYAVANVGTALLDSVLIPATADLYLYAGVAMGAIPALGYGYIQVSGYNADIDVDAPVTAAIAIGSAIYPVDGDTYLGEAAASTAPGTAPTYPSSVQILEAVATVSTAATTSVAGIIHARPYI